MKCKFSRICCLAIFSFILGAVSVRIMYAPIQKQEEVVRLVIPSDKQKEAAELYARIFTETIRDTTASSARENAERAVLAIYGVKEEKKY